MSRQMEDRLRAAYLAKTEQVTEERLEQLAARRQQALLDGDGDWARQESSISLFDGAVNDSEPLPLLPRTFDRPTGTRHSRWLAPALAAAAVVAIAVAVTAIATSGLGRSPSVSVNGGMVSHPAATNSAPLPTSGPTPAPTTSVSTPPSYLPRGQQGSRSQVPWSVVGAGWRLVLPTGSGPAALYLYDPAGGRYLISDRLPAGAQLLAWSPDGTRAMLRSGNSDAPRYREVNLRSGQLSTGFIVARTAFVGYTQPKGLAVILERNDSSVGQLARFSTTGALEHSYATDVPGHGQLNASSALYLPDGAEFVSALVEGPLVVMSNDGHLVRTYDKPSGYDYCTPLRLWTADTVLEVCMTPPGPGEPAAALFLQPVAGGPPSVLTEAAGQTEGGYGDAWLLSNGHVLLGNHVSCGIGGYDILVPGKAPRPLRGPAGVRAGTSIISMAGDLATFAVSDSSTCGGLREASALVDYNMVTGETHQLLDRLATIVTWPADL